MALREGRAQHLISAVPQRMRRRRRRRRNPGRTRRRNPGSTKTAPSRDQAAQRAPAAHPVTPPSAASSQEELRETFQRLGQLCRLARLPRGPLRKKLNPFSAFGTALLLWEPKPELKTLVGLACVIYGVFSSLGAWGQLVEMPSVGGLCCGILKAVCSQVPVFQSLPSQ